MKADKKSSLRHKVVFQAPFYWLNVPAILKLYFDEVFEYQFAYNSESGLRGLPMFMRMLSVLETPLSNATK